MHVCVCEREGERERWRGRKKERERHKERQRQKEELGMDLILHPHRTNRLCTVMNTRDSHRGVCVCMRAFVCMGVRVRVRV